MATVASGLNSGSGFNSSDTITSTTLNNHVNDATVTDIVFGDLASATVNDTDNMSDASATTLATSESIKAYVDDLSGLGRQAIYRTVNARGSDNTYWTNWSDLVDVHNLGSFGTGSSGVDQPHIFSFASTGTYLVEYKVNLFDKDTDTDRTYRITLQTTSDGSSYSDVFWTTSNGGDSGGTGTYVTDGAVKETLINVPRSLNLTCVFKCSDTSTQTLVVETEGQFSADMTKWEGAGVLQVTKLSSSLI